jgi:hypothetical protein
MNRAVRSTRKIVSYDEAAPPKWVRDPWAARIKSHMEKWQTLTPKERVGRIEPFFEAIMSSPECVAYYASFRELMPSKLYELSADARVYGASFVPLQRRLFQFLKGLKELDCYRATPKYVPKIVPPVVAAEVVVEKAVAPAVVVEKAMVAEVVVAPAVVAPEVVVEKVVAPEVVVEKVVAPAVLVEKAVAPAVLVEKAVALAAAPPSAAEEIAAMVLHKVGALERELADRKRAHEEDMATMLALLTEKDARISELEGRLQKVADALA